MDSLLDLPAKALAKAQRIAERGTAELHYLQKMIESGAFRLEPPQNLAGMVTDIRRWGEIGMVPALNARRTPNGLAIIDDEGSLIVRTGPGHTERFRAGEVTLSREAAPVA